MNTSKYAPVVLRYSLVIVFIFFGMNQLLNPASWVSLIPSWAISISGFSPYTILMLNGIFEVLLACMLAFGIWIRLVAGLLCIHLAMITINIGFSATGIRDLGLTLALLSISLQGGDELSFDQKYYKNN